MVSALFVLEDSIYKNLGIDCYDINRNALSFPLTNPVIAHPPCRSWGKLSHFCNYDHKEHQLALWAIRVIRRCGGVLEHPATSRLFKYYLPSPGHTDIYGGFSFCVDQFWFGHKARKKTLLYVCGCNPTDIPRYNLSFDSVLYVCGRNHNLNKSTIRKKEISRKERSQTPVDFARYLISIAELCKK